MKKVYTLALATLMAASAASAAIPAKPVATVSAAKRPLIATATISEKATLGMKQLETLPMTRKQVSADFIAPIAPLTPIAPFKAPAMRAAADDWTSVGTGLFVDGIISTHYGASTTQWDVEIQQNDATPTTYRIVNPYAKGTCPWNSNGTKTVKTGNDVYLTFDVTNPQAVEFIFSTPTKTLTDLNTKYNWDGALQLQKTTDAEVLVTGTVTDETDEGATVSFSSDLSLATVYPISVLSDASFSVFVPGLKAAVPGPEPVEPGNVDEIVGDWLYSSQTALQGMTGDVDTPTIIDAGDTPGTVYIEFPVINEYTVPVEATYHADGKLTILPQDVIFSGDNSLCTVEFKRFNTTSQEFEDLDVLEGTFDGTTLSFPTFDCLTYGDEEGFWIFDYAIAMTKVIPEDPNKDPNEGWTSLGNATFQDGWLLPAFSIDQTDSANWYEVEL
ncbi:MAG: hypothetical protein K2M97_04400, partial [Muribaculaceae bacterium]|nr:hypothetical protein [Muribaculaceae bacterium]